MDLQVRYVIDSWIEYVVVRKGVARKEPKVCGHYIAYKFIEGTVYRFDDGVVNSTTMLTEYETNLMFYHRANIPAYAWDIDFGFITYMSPDFYGRKAYSLRSSLPISIDLKQAMVESQPVFPEPVTITTTCHVSEVDKETDVVNAKTDNRTDTTDLPQNETSHVVDPNTDKRTDTSQLPQNETTDVVAPNTDNRTDTIDLHENETDSHAKASEVAHVDSNKRDAQRIPESDKTTEEDVSNETLQDLKNNPNIRILGVASIHSFDETVDYGSPDGSHSTSSGSSPHTDDEVNESKHKPDITLRPKLITKDPPLRKRRKRTCRRAQYTYAKPSRTQPSRAKKQTPTYMVDTDHSSIESDNDAKDRDFIPEGISGKLF